MPPKAAKPTSDELLAQFDNLGVNESGEKPSKPAQAKPDNEKGEGEDILAELDHLATQRPSSGPGTPRLSIDKPRSSTRSPRPSATVDRPSEDRASTRQSEDTGRSSRTGNKPEQSKPEAENVEAQEQAQGGGWWGGIFATASAAMKQAEAAVKEIQNNEEAQRWALQVKGNVGALKDFGMALLYAVRCLSLGLTWVLQAASFATWRSRHSPTSSTPLPLRSPRTNVSRSTSPMIFRATLALTR